MFLEFNRKSLHVQLSDQEENYFQSTSSFLSQNADGELMVKSGFFASSRKVGDVHRYSLQFVSGRWSLAKPNGEVLTKFAGKQHDQPVSGRANQLVLLLESPHKDEYDSKHQALGPALGASGRNIFTYFTSHVVPILENFGLNIDKKKEYSFCIVNPVQYQASLVDIHKEGLIKGIRDKVWMALWPECKADFIKRLKSYTPDIILNGCTSEVKGELKGAIATVQGAQCFDVTHPSAWQSALAGFKKP